jgi:hypothetical protein
MTRDAYLVVYPLLEDNIMLEVCRPLLEFLQVASMQHTAGNPCPPTLQERLGKVDYHVQPAMIQIRTTVLYHLSKTWHRPTRSTYPIPSPRRWPMV